MQYLDIVDPAWQQQEDDDSYDPDLEYDAWAEDQAMQQALDDARYNRWIQQAEHEDMYRIAAAGIVPIESETYTYEIVNGRRVLVDPLPF